MSWIESRQIVDMSRQGGAKALVTLVRAEGSSYRRHGAKILIGNEGYAGTVSGGCLEAEVVLKAAWIVRNGATVARYRTGFDEAGELTYGLGCGGTLDLLLEPAGTAEFTALMDAMQRALQGERLTVATWLPETSATADRGTTLRRAVLRDDGSVIFASSGIDPAKLAAVATQTLTDEGIFIERLGPPQRLIVVGAGDDAKPLVAMAALLGWSVTVVDGRSHLARAERFPAADHVLAANAESHTLDLRSGDAVVLMTHSYVQDRAWLTVILPISPRYFGVLGARHRTSLLITEAAAITGLSIRQCCERIYAPVGLDLGGDGPESIALAIIAEAQACVMGTIGPSRRLTEQDIAEQVREGGASRYTEAPCAL